MIPEFILGESPGFFLRKWNALATRIETEGLEEETLRCQDAAAIPAAPSIPSPSTP
jgi:hypothetical protein